VPLIFVLNATKYDTHALESKLRLGEQQAPRSSRRVLNSRTRGRVPLAPSGGELVARTSRVILTLCRKPSVTCLRPASLSQKAKGSI
jgi:hypothetical protein